MIITIDGPTASGKSTISRMVARELGFYYVASGFFFRAFAYLLVNKFIYTENTIMHPSAEHMAIISDPERFFYQYTSTHHERVFFDACDITPFLKDSFIDKMSSLLGTNDSVRLLIAKIQRDIASEYSVIVEGRDAGSVIFTDADIKIFITAPVEVRAERWCHDQKKRGSLMTYDDALAQISERDTRDKERPVAPLVIPDNAIVIDNGQLTIDEAVAKIIQYIHIAIETR